jgi:hypothetical protein
MSNTSNSTPQQPQNRDTAALERVRFAAEGHHQAMSLQTDQSERDMLDWLEAAAERSHWT